MLRLNEARLECSHVWSTATYITFFGLLFIVPSSMACQPQGVARQSTSRGHRVNVSPEQAQAPDSLVTLLRTGNAGIHTAQRAVIRDSASWANIWSIVTGPLSPSLPDVDFTSNIVILATAGPGGSWASITIDSVRMSGRELVVYVRESIAGDGACGLGDSMVRYPAHAVRVKRKAEVARFVNDSVVTACKR
jgi:hypothetical protein